MDKTDEIKILKKTAGKHKRQVMYREKDGEPSSPKSGEKKYRPGDKQLKSSYSEKRSSGGTERETENIRSGQKGGEGERKTKPKKRRMKEKGVGVSSDGGRPGEKRGRTGSGDEDRQDVRESQGVKESRGQGSRKNVRVWSVSYSSTVDQPGGDKTIRQETHRQMRDEVDECSQAQTLTHTDTDRKQGRDERDQADGSSEADQYVSWVQCSKPECAKWRQLRDGVDPSALPDDWTCSNNTDPALRSCSAQEEKFSVDNKEIFFYSLVPGSLVWARQSGYPWWPAMVERDPDTGEYLEFWKVSDLTPYKCHVTFFGEPVTRAWLVCSRVRGYADLSEEHLLKEADKALKDSMRMAKEALKLSVKERLEKFGFLGRYVSDRESSEDSDIAEMLDLFFGKAENDDSNEDLWSKKQKLTGRKLKERKRERKRSGRARDNDETRREGDRRKRMKKKLKEGKEGLTDSVPVKGGKEKKCSTPSFTLPEKKKQQGTGTADQTVPQSNMEMSTGRNFDLDMHSKGEEMLKERERMNPRAEEEDREAGEEREDDEDGCVDAPDRGEEEDRLSFMLLMRSED
ncbi:uncharacterized protein Hap1MRO34_023976 isoform 2-T2 [Clarias gariepinus]|uniref:zinc finger CW-type PWWP domain protein 1-like isoform X2 n=1 Tax=Clarias gariepinus TaxID=13013 RepID=UPI00234C360C|nr:zinc finger CW-type PWWP domain protein 1-like isoform X2 [Clarias gariepinus]